jgi:hypothetical protein
MYESHLPLSPIRDKRHRAAAKCTTDILAEIGDIRTSLPNGFRRIRRLEVDDDPNEALMIPLMVEPMYQCGAQWDEPDEWHQMEPEAFPQCRSRRWLVRKGYPLGALAASRMPFGSTHAFTRENHTITRGKRQHFDDERHFINLRFEHCKSQTRISAT